MHYHIWRYADNGRKQPMMMYMDGYKYPNRTQANRHNMLTPLGGRVFMCEYEAQDCEASGVSGAWNPYREE